MVCHVGGGPAGRGRFADMCFAAVAHGWNADWYLASLLPACVLVGSGVISVHCWVLREHVSVCSVMMPDESRPCGWWVVRCCVLFENCTVDASIFVVSV